MSEMQKLYHTNKNYSSSKFMTDREKKRATGGHEGKKKKEPKGKMYHQRP